MVISLNGCSETTPYAENYCLQREILSQCLVSPLIHDVSTSVDDCQSFAYRQARMPIGTIPKECRYH